VIDDGPWGGIMRLAISMLDIVRSIGLLMYGQWCVKREFICNIRCSFSEQKVCATHKICVKDHPEQTQYRKVLYNIRIVVLE